VPHWHGQTVTLDGMRTDAIDIEDNQVKVVDMLPDNPGIWLLHSHVAGHLQGGMEARSKVVP
jgi:FtsP/CotA-like multicopper oxidase with cupredoxin domain